MLYNNVTSTSSPTDTSHLHVKTTRNRFLRLFNSCEVTNLVETIHHQWMDTTKPHKNMFLFMFFAIYLFDVFLFTFPSVQYFVKTCKNVSWTGFVWPKRNSDSMDSIHSRYPSCVAWCRRCESQWTVPQRKNIEDFHGLTVWQKNAWNH